MPDRSNSDLLDLVYETAFDPTLWAPVMQRFADMVGGGASWLSQLDVADGSGGDGDPMVRIDPLWFQRYLDHFGQRNPLHKVSDPHGYMRRWTPRVLTDEDWMAKDALIRTEFYNDFLRPQDIHSVLMIRLAAIGMEIVTLNIARSGRNGQFDAADLEVAAQYHPHLIRAFNLGRRLAATRQMTGALSGVLDASSHGLFLLDADGAVRHVNRAGERLLGEPEGLRRVGGRLVAPNTSDARRLQALIHTAASASAERRAGGSLALKTPTRNLPLSVIVAPIRSERFAPIRAGYSVLVCVTDLQSGGVLPEQRLRDLFGLTPAETRVALAVFEGLAPKEIAATFGVSQHTVHVQLARVFDKTGTNRQADLMRLMMRLVGAGLA